MDSPRSKSSDVLLLLPSFMNWFFGLEVVIIIEVLLALAMISEPIVANFGGGLTGTATRASVIVKLMRSPKEPLTDEVIVPEEIEAERKKMKNGTISIIFS